MRIFIKLLFRVALCPSTCLAEAAGLSEKRKNKIGRADDRIIGVKMFKLAMGAAAALGSTSLHYTTLLPHVFVGLVHADAELRDRCLAFLKDAMEVLQILEVAAQTDPE